jgi:hypothetical protein
LLTQEYPNKGKKLFKRHDDYPFYVDDTSLQQTAIVAKAFSLQGT